jgi:hypothetical protein
MESLCILYAVMHVLKVVEDACSVNQEHLIFYMR